MRLSEKGRRSLRGSLTEHLNGTFRPILASLRLPIPRSECCSYPCSDCFYAKLGELYVAEHRRNPRRRSSQKPNNANFIQGTSGNRISRKLVAGLCEG